ncbi:hypothetical protein ACIP4Y_30625 [Streptomyces sp. NPDC088810]|uniref:hypothetical protein n=1 Tax=Streptomyces sp. NPDC088810 TaxID=3365904 RepID=UPI003818C8FA
MATPDIPGLTDSPGVAQNLRLHTTLKGEPLELLQSQVYLGMEDVRNPTERAVVEFVLTAKPTHPTTTSVTPLTTSPAMGTRSVTRPTVEII